MIKLGGNKGFLLSLILGVFAFPLVSAQTAQDARILAEKVIDLFVNLLSPIFEFIIGDVGTSQFFFAKVLIFLLLFIVVSFILGTVERFKKQKWVIRIIALTISVFAVRYMSDTELISGILLPYSAVGLAITTILPFIVFFYFVHVTSLDGLGRRLMWLFFGIVFFALFITRYSELPDMAKYLYWAIVIGIALAFMFDKGIHRYFYLHELTVFHKSAKNRTIAGLQAEYLNILSVDSEPAKKRRDEIETKLKDLGGDVP